MLFRPLFPVAEYLINYDYISKVLCVNKEKPQLRCNGKCHLMKELAKAAEDEKPLSDKKTTAKETEVLFYQEINNITFVKTTPSFKKVANTSYSNLYTYLGSDTAFHPPTTLS